MKKLLFLLMAFTLVANFAFASREDDFRNFVKEGNLNMVKKLIEDGVNVNVSTVDDRITALHDAADSRNSMEMIELLVSAGADINASTAYTKSTPLIVAAAKGNVGNLRALLDLGANIDAKGHRGDTALHFAAYYGQIESVKVLLERDANLYIKNSAGKIAKQVADKYGQRTGDYRMAKLILYKMISKDRESSRPFLKRP